MKRILPLILALVAGMAQADSNSDYRAGSDFARQIQGQGTGSIQSFKPQESIPGYNANPDETKYYGGVTAGGDGGLKNDGTTEWATGETGKTITESFMNKPKDILSPDAPFIQTGRDVVNRADSIVGNTGQQCSAQEISRSEYTNYTCERDLQVEQYCTRTARMELQGSTTWETRTLEYEMSQLLTLKRKTEGETPVRSRKTIINVTTPPKWKVKKQKLAEKAAREAELAAKKAQARQALSIYLNLPTLDEAVNTLKPWWPGLFDGDTPRLLACGIRDVLLEDVAQRNIPLSHKKLRRALKAITRSESYLCAMKAGACRYDTEGYVTEHISQEEEVYAAARLDKIRRQNRIKAELQAVLDEK